MEQETVDRLGIGWIVYEPGEMIHKDKKWEGHVNG